MVQVKYTHLEGELDLEEEGEQAGCYEQMGCKESLSMKTLAHLSVDPSKSSPASCERHSTCYQRADCQPPAATVSWNPAGRIHVY